MAEVQTITDVKNFDDILTEFENPGEEKSKKSSFNDSSDSFENIIEEEESSDSNEKNKKSEEEEGKKDESSIEKILEEFEEEEEEEEDKGKFSKKSSSNLISAINKLVEKGEFFLFEDKQDINDYTEEELIELIQENDKFKKEKALEEEVKEFFESLPKELQYAAQYVANGGTDLKSIFKALASTQEIKELDVKKDAETIIRNYYSVLEWEDEDIEDKIEMLKDLGSDALEREAAKVKPKLDKMNEEVLQAELQKQEELKRRQVEEMQKYFQNAAETIKKGEIGGIKLDKETQVELYSGLTEAKYTSRRGIPTNELGHLLEKYQYIEPDFDKMYKVLWLLKDEKTFFEKFSSKKVNETVEKTVRTLKTEQGNKSSNSTQVSDEEDSKIKRTIKRSKPDFMKGLNK